MVFVSSAIAGKSVSSTQLKVDKSTMSSTALTSGTPVTSDSVKVAGSVGFAALLVEENISGGAGDVDIFAEYSEDNSTWHRAYTTSGGTLTIEDNIVTALQNSARYIVFTPRLGKYVRITFDPDANSEIESATLIIQEEY